MMFCRHCTNRIHNKAGLCLICLEEHDPRPRRIALPFPKVPSLDSELVERWAFCFQLIQKAGGASLPLWRQLSALEGLVVLFNPFALVLGPVYLVWLGLRRQAVLMSAIWLVLPALCLLLLNEVLALVSAQHPALWGNWLVVQPFAWGAVWLVAALVFAARTNLQFYRKLEKDQEGRNGLG